jgi:hypothetical protein
MRKNKIICTVLLTAIVSTSALFAQPANAMANSENQINISANLYTEAKSEVVTIDNIKYTYQYSIENGNNVITVTNDANDITDKILVDNMNSNIYLNGEVIGKSYTQSKEISGSSKAYYVWETKSSDSYYISWAKGTSAAALAAVIAAKLGTLGVGGVIAAMGVGALGAIASACSGGTVYNTLQMFRAPFTNPQYRTIWAFKASTGDYYGDYIYHW